jgi:hypothetical protein
MKTFVMFVVNQNSTTHYPMVVSKVDWQMLCEVDFQFKDSSTLEMLFKAPECKTIVVMIYVEKGSKNARRRIGGFMQELNESQIKEQTSAMANSVGVDMTWHSRDEYLKILPMDKAQRELIRSMSNKIQ